MPYTNFKQITSLEREKIGQKAISDDFFGKKMFARVKVVTDTCEFAIYAESLSLFEGEWSIAVPSKMNEEEARLLKQKLEETKCISPQDFTKIKFITFHRNMRHSNARGMGFL